MARYHIQPWAKIGSLKNSTVLDLTTELSEMKIENDLRREVQENIRRLKDMGTYRGRRHAMGLPVRGQRTRSQVRRSLQDNWCWRLTAIDYNGKATEQDGTRWFWADTGLRKETIAYNCNIMYTRHRQKGHWRYFMKKFNYTEDFLISRLLARSPAVVRFSSYKIKP
jgi:ribosomal protein S13